LDITRIYIGEVGLRGLGLGEDAVRAVLRFAFEDLKCERVTLDYMTANERAHNLYLKCGFKDEGCMRHGGKKNGRYIDLNLMSILREEYVKYNR
jgi:RimJ/RimL family protein N-acetyltransferase